MRNIGGQCKFVSGEINVNGVDQVIGSCGLAKRVSN